MDVTPLNPGGFRQASLPLHATSTFRRRLLRRLRSTGVAGNGLWSRHVADNASQPCLADSAPLGFIGGGIALSLYGRKRRRRVARTALRSERPAATLIIAEKPKVMSMVAKALSSKFVMQRDSRADYWEAPQGLQGRKEGPVYVASAAGHLVRADAPVGGSLPIFPSPFQLRPASDRADQRLKLIQDLALKASLLVNACDAGREGELIFRRIVQYLGLDNKPFTRMWLQSLTPEAIRKAYLKPRPANAVSGLASAATRRSEADWFVGINCTVALRRNKHMPPGFTVGRVRTPTLAIVVKREHEILDFSPEPYQLVKATFAAESSDYTYEGVIDSRDFKGSKEDWQTALAGLVGGAAGTVVKDMHTESTQKASSLMNLADLQKEASRSCNLTPAQTLQCAQMLYEREFITYPRTDSRHLPEDYKSEVESLLDAASSSDISGFSKLPALRLSEAKKRVDVVGKAVFDNSKVTDHFALVPTTAGLKRYAELAGDSQKKVFGLIFGRFVAALLPGAQFRVVDRETSVAGLLFRTKVRELFDLGYLEALGKKLPDKRAPRQSLKKGTPVRLTAEPVVEEKKTRAPLRYSQATLLAAMENCASRVEDATLKDGLQAGIGTSATRASIIDSLLARGLLKTERPGEQNGLLQPTTQGMELIDSLRGDALNIPDLASPEMTANWELMLKDIEGGDTQTEKTFDEGIRRFVTKAVQQAGGPAPEKVIRFGSYKGCSFNEVRIKYPSYCDWVIEQTQCDGPLREFRQYLLTASPSIHLTASATDTNDTVSHVDVAEQASMKAHHQIHSTKVGKSNGIDIRLIKANGVEQAARVNGAQQPSRNREPRAKPAAQTTNGFHINTGKEDAESKGSEGKPTLPLEIQSMKVAELKQLLRERGLPVSGKKAELQARLLAAEGRKP
eukprot:TRINITY_DN50844_c0_g1_i1.p1 TRINITY_DN50844_c0_g1~~TRINITY_DN50844_c0_g1_i1.p1  ORF type:complete len:908 (-),score=164.30 TRINITY_DN50844_c0_g1_i1:401-3124(-)